MSDTFPLLTTDDLLAMPAPSYLIEDIVPSVGLGELFGASGTTKSFLAMDWGLCVAAEVPWHGHEVEGGWVVYIAAEGASGMGARWRAWSRSRGIEQVPRFRVLPAAVNLLEDATIEKLRRTLAELPEPPKLVVIDTMARSMRGGDENSTRDVGMFVAAVDELVPTGVRLVVHHQGWEGERERGSSALRGAADMVARLRRNSSGGLVLSCEKVKDGPPFEDLTLKLDPVAESCVLSLVIEPDAAAPGLRERLSDALAAAEGPLSQNRLREIVGARRGTVGNEMQAMKAAGLAEQSPNGWMPVPTASGPGGTGGTGAPEGAVPREGLPFREAPGDRPEPSQVTENGFHPETDPELAEFGDTEAERIAGKWGSA